MPGGKSGAAQKLFKAVVDGDEELSREATRELLGEGWDPRSIITEVLVPAMRKVGELYERGEYFIPELVMSAEAFRAAMDLLRPHFKGSGVPVKAVAVFGTVRGDIRNR
ncbi:B12-binding domain-containing protein [Infirmifilum sp. SLHALR2]|nr:MAG: hypothetical protein B7L53_06150 [Thermofilum sp. NZ13]